MREGKGKKREKEIIQQSGQLMTASRCNIVLNCTVLYCTMHCSIVQHRQNSPVNHITVQCSKVHSSRPQCSTLIITHTVQERAESNSIAQYRVVQHSAAHHIAQYSLFTAHHIAQYSLFTAPLMWTKATVEPAAQTPLL